MGHRCTRFGVPAADSSRRTDGVRPSGGEVHRRALGERIAGRGPVERVRKRRVEQLDDIPTANRIGDCALDLAVIVAG
jgi:hypothetical protein